MNARHTAITALTVLAVTLTGSACTIQPDRWCEFDSTDEVVPNQWCEQGVPGTEWEPDTDKPRKKRVAVTNTKLVPTVTPLSEVRRPSTTPSKPGPATSAKPTPPKASTTR